MKLFTSKEEIPEYVQTQEDYSLISGDLPLIYNLNILENIAIIKEVHENMSVLEAEQLAEATLQSVGLKSLGVKRAEQCLTNEIFCVMLIRAMMCKENTIIIEYPELLLESLKDIGKMIDIIALLRSAKTIVFLDIKNNENYYKGSICNIIK